MANALDLGLEGKHVIVSSKYYIGSNIERIILCKGGNGCYAFTYGSCISARFIFDGEECRVEGYQVERLATPEEVSQAEKIFNSTN